MDGGASRPASLSSAVTTTLLRDELRFEGVAITDSLDMGAVRRATGDDVAEAMFQALMAGNGAAWRRWNGAAAWGHTTAAGRMRTCGSTA